MGQKGLDISIRVKRHFELLKVSSFYGGNLPHWINEKAIYHINGVYPAIKEIMIAVYVGTYTTAIQGMKRNKKDVNRAKPCYLDMTAGTGFIKLTHGDKSFLLFGSATIGLLAPTYFQKELRNRKKIYPFYKAIFIEYDKSKYMVLKNIIEDVCEKLHELNLPCPEYHLIFGDANTLAKDVINKHDDCDHWLVVIDPEGMEISWKTLKALLDTRKVDVIFNYMCAAIRRQLRHACQAKHHAFHQFFGNTNWESLCNNNNEDYIGEKLHEIYIQSIRELGYYVKTASVFANRLFDWHYHLDVIVKKENPPWLRGFEEYSRFLENLKESGLVNILLSNTLSDYIYPTHTNTFH
ncbi:three-Cys-motif partner protein TcmP [Pyrobaculum aerophilum]|uniref:Three-Cys-motif partner protein TcmP n=1 Tax=Pyrobaculum aerophilum TaxID=13773 RepID=A0A371R6X2_9CREN|nr:three-Cys-motif partner protein TcmP [Pyrobaculum aerophilum]RFA94619.1 hypothetical protein CGL51_09520 [Pyrobaculum aerophilum]RFB00283.1 hypothetical protein CGL52_01560 [Pyrobaculum aerophilum]